MSFTYLGLTTQQISDAYKGYAELLIEKKVGPAIANMAAQVLDPHGAAAEIAQATSRKELLDATGKAIYLASRTHELAEYFALRDDRGRKAYAMFSLMGAFSCMMTMEYNSIDAEQEKYLKESKKSPKLFSKKPTIKQCYPHAVLPKYGDIVIAWEDASGEATDKMPSMDEARAIQAKVSTVLLNATDLVIRQDWNGIGSRREGISLRSASEETLNHLKKNAERIGVKPESIRWATPGF
jgi:hypothetical protein